MSDYVSNIKENWFQFPTLTPISGDPNYENLANLTQECKSNGRAVTSTLGGGNQGHLGMITSAAAYTRIAPGTPFIRPALPVLTIAADATQFQIAEARHAFSEATKTFEKCNQVERCIIQLINAAIDKECLADLYDDETGSLSGTIPEIIQSLMDTFGAITPQTLAAAKAKVEETNYEHSRPIANMFTRINEYSLMADHARASETAQQMINMGLIIITRSNIFSSDIRKWNRRPDIEKTWPNFKAHFSQAQKDIKASQPTITTDVLGYHGQANAVTTLVDQVTQQVMEHLTSQPHSEAEDIAEQQIQQAVDHMANSTQQSASIITQMQALAATISTLQTQVNNNQNQRGRGGGGRGGRGGRGGGRGGRGRGGGTASTPMYCWTHGNCAHAGCDCKTPGVGHIEGATYANMQGGSTYNCHWL